MSEFKSLKSLKRKVAVTLSGFETPINFNLFLPTKGSEKIDLETRAKRISKLFDGKDSSSKEAGTKKANELIASLIFDYSDLKEKEFEIDGEIYKVENSETLFEITTELELADFFMSLKGDEETISRINRLSQKTQK